MLTIQRLFHSTAIGMIFIAGPSPVFAQQRTNGQSPPASSAYGTAGAGNQLRPGGNNNPTGAAGRPVSSPPNSAFNPSLNPAFNPAGPPNQGQANRGNGPATQPPFMPQPFPDLTPAQQTYLDQVLGHWQKSTTNVERYACDFKRWTYDSSNPVAEQLSKSMNRAPNNVELSVALGVLKYMAPDQGLYKVERLGKATGQVIQNSQIEMKEYENQFGEWWICDGKSIHDLDRGRKVCDRYPIPTELQGQGIMNSPMPFLFGVDAEKIKARYWVRPVEPPMDSTGKPSESHIALEAYPKLPEDATNFHHVKIILDKQAFLPFQMIRYNTEWSENHDVRDVYQFENRVMNSNLLQKISEALFRKEFIPSAVDKDWTVQEHPFQAALGGPMAGGGPQESGPQAQAGRPQAGGPNGQLGIAGPGPGAGGASPQGAPRSASSGNGPLLPLKPKR